MSGNCQKYINIGYVLGSIFGALVGVIIIGLAYVQYVKCRFERP
jgi:hypothetical protein